MLIRNVTSKKDLANQKKLQAELLQIQIDNQNLLTQRISDYQNPNKPPPVPPQYKTSTEMQMDSLLQQRETIDNLREIGLDFQQAAQVSQELAQLPDGDGNFIKFNRNAPFIKADIAKKLNRKTLDAQSVMEYLIRFFSNLDSAIGINIKDTTSTNFFQNIPLSIKGLLASQEDYGELGAGMTQIFATDLYNKGRVADPIMRKIDELVSYSPTKAQIESIDTMPTLERQQYNLEGEQLVKVYKLPETGTITSLTNSLATAFQNYDQNDADTKTQLNSAIASLQQVLNNVNTKSIEKLYEFSRSFKTKEVGIQKLGEEVIGQQTELQFIKETVDSQFNKIRDQYNLGPPLLTEEARGDIIQQAEDAGKTKIGSKTNRPMVTAITKSLNTSLAPYIEVVVKAQQESQTKISKIVRGKIAKKELGVLKQQEAARQERISQFSESVAARKLKQNIPGMFRGYKSEKERQAQEAEAQAQAQAQEAARLAQEAEATRLQGSIRTRNELEAAFRPFIYRKNNKFRSDNVKMNEAGVPADRLAMLLEYNTPLGNLQPPIMLTNRSSVADAKIALQALLATQEFSGTGLYRGRGLTEKVLKHFNKDNKEMMQLKKGFNKHLKVEKEVDSDTSSEASYKGNGVKSAFKSRRIKLGRGIAIAKDEPRFREFGKYIINYPQLVNDNVLNLKFPSTGTIPSIKPVTIDENFKDFIIDVLDSGKVNQRHYESLTNAEKSHFMKIARGAKVVDILKIKPSEDDQEVKDMKRLELLFGEINAGNDNDKMLKECKTLIKKYVANGRINKNKGLEMLLELE